MKFHSVTVILSLFLIYGFAIAYFLIPAKEFSEKENRVLASFSAPSLREIADGGFSENIGAVYADRLPLRDFFLGSKSVSEYLLCRRENGSVFFASRDTLVKRLEIRDREKLADNLAAIEEIRYYEEARGIPTVTVILPRAIDIFADRLPALFPQSLVESAWEGVDTNYRDLLRAKAAAGDEVWYRTDHHWTTLGAYYAYEALGEVLSFAPLPRDRFREETVTTDFLGTSASSSLFPFAHPDKIVLFRYDGDEDFLVTDIPTEKADTGFYRTEYLDTHDKYSCFLGGNTAHLRVRAENGERPTLLLIKDSFALSLVPFLARHFDIDLIDPRYVRTPGTDYLDAAAEKKPDACLILFSLDTLTGETGLPRFCEKAVKSIDIK